MAERTSEAVEADAFLQIYEALEVFFLFWFFDYLNNFGFLSFCPAFHVSDLRLNLLVFKKNFYFQKNPILKEI